MPLRCLFFDPHQTTDQSNIRVRITPARLTLEHDQTLTQKDVELNNIILEEVVSQYVLTRSLYMSSVNRECHHILTYVRVYIEKVEAKGLFRQSYHILIVMHAIGGRPNANSSVS